MHTIGEGKKFSRARREQGFPKWELRAINCKDECDKLGEAKWRFDEVTSRLDVDGASDEEIPAANLNSCGAESLPVRTSHVR